MISTKIGGEWLYMSNSDLTTGSIFHHIKRIAIPSSIGFVFRTLYNVVDTFYAGQLGENALAGLSMSFPVFFMLIALSAGLGTGATALLAIALGKKDKQEFHKLILNAFAIGFSIFVLIMLSSSTVSRFLLQLIGGEGIALEHAISYTNVIFWGSGFFILNQLINGVLSSQGDTKSLRNVLIIGFFLNIFLDPLLIFGWFGLPQMGTSGIALATIITEFTGSVYLLYRLSKSPMFKIDLLKKAKISFIDCLSVLKQSIPASLNMMTIVLGSFIINYFVVKYGGQIALAAYGVAFRIEQLALLPAFGINAATLAIVGQNYGAKNFKRIFETYRIALLTGIAIMTLGIIIIYPFSRYLIGFFNSNEQVIAIGVQYLRIEIFTFYSYVILYISTSILQGLKKPGFIVYIGIFRQAVFPILLFLYLGTVLEWGLLGVWWGIVIVNWSAVLITVTYTLYNLKQLTGNQCTLLTKHC